MFVTKFPTDYSIEDSRTEGFQVTNLPKSGNVRITVERNADWVQRISLQLKNGHFVWQDSILAHDHDSMEARVGFSQGDSVNVIVYHKVNNKGPWVENSYRLIPIYNPPFPYTVRIETNDGGGNDWDNTLIILHFS